MRPQIVGGHKTVSSVSHVSLLPLWKCVTSAVAARSAGASDDHTTCTRATIAMQSVISCGAHAGRRQLLLVGHRHGDGARRRSCSTKCERLRWVPPVLPECVRRDIRSVTPHRILLQASINKSLTGDRIPEVASRVTLFFLDGTRLPMTFSIH